MKQISKALTKFRARFYYEDNKVIEDDIYFLEITKATQEELDKYGDGDHSYNKEGKPFSNNFKYYMYCSHLGIDMCNHFDYLINYEAYNDEVIKVEIIKLERRKQWKQQLNELKGVE